MLSFRPLHVLKNAVGAAIALDGLPGHPPLRGPDDAYFGHEWARWRYDTFDAWVDAWLRTRHPGETDILDLGCATGARGAEFARAGHRVTAVDIVDRSADIATRNQELRADCEGTSPLITFVQADLASGPQHDWDSRFALVHARRVLNFIHPHKLEAALAAMDRAVAPGGLLAASFIGHALDADGGSGTGREGVPRALPLCPGLHSYQVGAILDPLRARRLTIVEAFSDGRAEVGLIVRKPAPNGQT